MDQKLLTAVTGQLKSIVGDRASPGHQDRFAAIQVALGNYTGLLGLDDAQRTASWTAERVASARELLIMLPWLEKVSRDLLCRELAIQVTKKFGRTEITAFVEPLVRWAMFEDTDPKKGADTVLAHSNISGAIRWSIVYDLISIGLWRMQSVMPALIEHPDFNDSKIQIWSMIYGCLPDFTSRYAHLRELEVPLPQNDPQVAKRADQSTIKVGVWSHKIGDFLSSATQVHPWLMRLAEPGLDVYILSERRTGDALQNKYRETFGPRFIDCSEMTDADFLKTVKELDLDILIPLHPSRKDLIQTHRLARCHLDTWADMAIHGVPDMTVISRGMLDSRFISTTSRKFVVIPDPPHVYSTLPELELKDRDPSARFVFGAFNRAPKMNPIIFDVWARVMLACPNAALMVAFLQVDFFSEYVLKSELGKRGVEPSRIIVLPRVAHMDHLERHNSIDLMLDTAPMGGGMTAVDTFFMGVPLLSLNIDYRPSALHTNNAFFNALGPEAGLSAQSIDQYIEYAKVRYKAGPRRKTQRQKLREVAARSALFDHDGYMKLIRLIIKAAVANTGDQLTYIDTDPRKK